MDGRTKAVKSEIKYLHLLKIKITLTRKKPSLFFKIEIGFCNSFETIGFIKNVLVFEFIIYLIVMYGNCTKRL